MRRLPIRLIAALVLLVLGCGYGHLLADGLGTGHHHGSGAQAFVTSDDAVGPQADDHRHSHHPDTPCGEWLCHCHFSLCNMIGTKVATFALCQNPMTFPDAANEFFNGRTAEPPRLPPRNCLTA
jgi:hypothetical protein